VARIGRGVEDGVTLLDTADSYGEHSGQPLAVDHNGAMPASALPWSSLADGPPLTVDDVRRRCARFRAPQRRALGFDLPDARLAATLVLVVDAGGEAAVVVTQRASTMTYHRGDWVFPGGRMDPAVDATLADTARREAEEELGIPREHVDIVAEIDSHGPISTGFVIHVYVGVVDGAYDLAPDPREVAEAAVVPVSRFASHDGYDPVYPFPQDHQPGPLAEGAPERLQVRWLPDATVECFFVRPGEIMWGTQATILANLLKMLAAAGEH
jgi:8-oxo-dGTP pyrophosphatase MutT (NUDIX family)